MATTPKRRMRSLGDEAAPVDQLFVLRLYIGGASLERAAGSANEG